MAVIVTGISAVLLLVGAAVILLAFLKSKGRYDDWIEPLDEKEFRTKNFLGIGLFLAENIDFTSRFPKPVRELLQKYNGRVSAQITELYGVRESAFYFTIHNANKWVMSLLVYCFLAIFALISCSNGEYSNAAIFAACAPLALCALPFVLDNELKTKIENRREQILLEFPEFVNKLMLLVNAGTTIPKAWEKIVLESTSKSPLYRELRICMAEIHSGKPEAVAYEEFARRCKVKEIIKFVSVIVLNLRKGGSEIIPTLRAQSDECWEARKAAAKRLGEKASSKLLFPMAIMLLGIIIIVALPAVLALTGM